MIILPRGGEEMEEKNDGGGERGLRDEHASAPMPRTVVLSFTLTGGGRVMATGD